MNKGYLYVLLMIIMLFNSCNNSKDTQAYIPMSVLKQISIDSFSNILVFQRRIPFFVVRKGLADNCHYVQLVCRNDSQENIQFKNDKHWVTLDSLSLEKVDVSFLMRQIKNSLKIMKENNIKDINSLFRHDGLRITTINDQVYYYCVSDSMIANCKSDPTLIELGDNWWASRR